MKCRLNYRLFFLLSIGLILSECGDLKKSSGKGLTPSETPKEEILALKNVNIVPMAGERKVIENATVLIQGNKISSINAAIPENAKTMDCKGKWLIPGLIDMHVHVPTDGHFNTRYPTRTAVVFVNTQDIMTPFVANGVTTILELNSQPGHFGQRNEILRGDVIGPRMALSALIEGGDGSGKSANTPSDGRQSVRIAKAEGYEFIKVYSKLNIDTYDAIVDEAYKQGLKVAGHIPNAFRERKEEALVPHLGMVAHAEEFFKHNENFDDADAQRYAKLCKKNGTWLSPTLFIMVSAAEQSSSLEGIRTLPSLQYVHPLLQSKWLTANNYRKNATPESADRFKRMHAANMRLVKAFRAEGVPIVAGTDAGSSGVVWGFSLHDELALLAASGLSPEEVLASATRLPARWLGIDSLAGTVEPGKFADLVLLDANPLDDIGNTRKISGVCINGNWIDKSGIDSMLADLSKRNSKLKNNYDWSKRGEY